jgi:hypothetical protein
MDDLIVSRFDRDGLELYVDESTGLAYAHQEAIRRMLGIKSRGGALHNHLRGVSKDRVKTARIQTEGGVQGVLLYSAEVVFEMALEFAPELAKKMGAAGANVFLLGLAGYQLQVAPRAVQAPTLPCHMIAIEKADAIRHITDTLNDHPRLAQVLIDSAINDIVEKQALLASRLRGVAEVANEMGYSTDASSRVRLGIFIKNRRFDAQKEKRFCNGTMQEINCYEDTVDLRQAITDFFEH